MGRASLLALVSLLLLLSHSNCRHLNSVDDHAHHHHHHAERSLKSPMFNLTSVKRYLLHYGYLDSNRYDKLPGESVDEHLSAAIKKYQTFFKLDPTGMLDDATVHQMTLPRCGNPDIVTKGCSSTARSGNSSRMLYKLSDSKWQPFPRNLTYSINPANQKFSMAELSSVFGAAFKSWQVFAPLHFVEAPTNAASDITIKFFFGDHGDGHPFDGPRKVLAHATFPPDGRAHFDAAETWEIDAAKVAATEGAKDLPSVALHELGHVIGLDHSDDPNSVMFPSIPAGTTRRILTHDDILGIGQLYVPYSPPLAGSP